eukprot:3272939-Rhodomonas_salina.2
MSGTSSGYHMSGTGDDVSRVTIQVVRALDRMSAEPGAHPALRNPVVILSPVEKMEGLNVIRNSFIGGALVVSAISMPCCQKT